MLTVDLLRHGEPEGGQRLRGGLDDPLSETGWAQLRAVTEQGRDWTAIVSSPLRRCREFAAELAAERDLPHRVIDELHEIRFGDWEGRTTESLWANPEDRAVLQAYWNDGINCPPPGGERLDHFAERVACGWEKLLDEYAEGHVLVVAHGGTNRTLMCNALGLPVTAQWGFEVPYACLSRLRVYREPGQRASVLLAFHNGQA